MHDIKLIRSNPGLFDQLLSKRGESTCATEILALDEEIRAVQVQLQELQARKNEIAKEIGQAKNKGVSVEHLMVEAEKVKAKIPNLEAEDGRKKQQLQDILCVLPNLPALDVVEGKDEDDNKIVRTVGTPREFSFTPRDHTDIGESLGMMDFVQTSEIAGARFVTLSGPLAKLERALASFMLDMHTTEFGYTEASPPYLVKPSAMFGVGQLPKFADESFTTIDDRRLIPTAEVSLTNLVANSIIPAIELPRRYTAYTPCFRKEAGSAGRDTRGMIRLHQFSKVELVSITRPEDSAAEHERMTEIAEEVLKRLGLPYRVMMLCTGDMGFSATKTYDLEVWIPSQGKYREISSCSNCGDFQARRMNARYKNLEGKNNFVHTLNGSALAVGRTLVALLENYQESDGTVNIPDCLINYMGGVTKITHGKKNI